MKCIDLFSNLLKAIKSQKNYLIYKTLKISIYKGSI